MGTKKAWGRESQRTPGEWNFRNGESVVPAWSSCLGPDGGVYATPFSWPVHGSPTPCSISVPFLPEGLFYCTFKILLLFFSALHKVLTHVANGCRLVIYAHYSPF